ncbi:hypothetical protein ACFU3O_04870 [Streptomyces antibioticus]|uniref:hypothetical protein n=1 Tax=Streptomyces antibioticus TaxID=1890 RepID=UPI0036CAAB47
MTDMNAMELEIGLYDWSRLTCRSCKSAAHVPGELHENDDEAPTMQSPGRLPV